MVQSWDVGWAVNFSVSPQTEWNIGYPKKISKLWRVFDFTTLSKVHISSDDGLFAVPVSEEKVASHLGDSSPL